MSRPWSRSCSNSGSLLMAASRRAWKPVFIIPSACWRPGSTSDFFTFSLNEWLVDSIASGFRLADRRRVGHSCQHLGDVADSDRRSLALELARHVHQAAQVTGEQRVG